MQNNKDIIFYSYEEYIRYMYPETADEILNNLTEEQKCERYGREIAKNIIDKIINK